MDNPKQYLFSKHFYSTPETEDTVIVRDRVFNADGTFRTRVFAVENYKRPFYITKPEFRNHKQKKETEDLAKLDKYYSTQSNLPNEVNSKLKVAFRPIMRDIKKSPYIYEIDTDVNVFISDKYRDKYPDHLTHPMQVCSLDIETDVSQVTPHKDSVIMISMAMGNKAYIGVLASLYPGMNEEQITRAISESNHKYLKKNLKDKKVIIKVYNTEGGLIKNTFKGLHAWNPDILNIFNMNFDIPKIMQAAKRNDIRMEDLFHSPQLDKKYKYFKYQEGNSIKRKSDGTETPIPFHQRWHTVKSSAGFEVLDSMCGYKQIRAGAQELPYYNLDFILNKELGSRKLKFKETDHLVKLAWHIEMQRKYPVEYASYAIYDSIGLIELDDQTFDLKYTLYASMNGLPYQYTPRRSTRAYHLVRGHVRPENKIPSCGFVYNLDDIKKMDPDKRVELGLDGRILDNDNWIVTVPAGNNQDVGLCMLKDCPDTHTGIRTNNNDDDIKSAYPSTMDAFNTSKPTTSRELIGVEGMDENYFRPANMGTLLGPSYYSIFPIEMYGYLNYKDLDKMVDKYTS